MVSHRIMHTSVEKVPDFRIDVAAEMQCDHKLRARSDAQIR
jgi:hypothetical protein